MAGELKAPAHYYCPGGDGGGASDGVTDRDILCEGAHTLVRTKKRARSGIGRSLPIRCMFVSWISSSRLSHPAAAARSRESSKESALSAAERCAVTDRLELLRHLHGATVLKKSQGGGALVTFSPCVLGRVCGPYKMALDKRAGGKWVLKSSDVPLPKNVLDIK